MLPALDIAHDLLFGTTKTPIGCVVLVRQLRKELRTGSGEACRHVQLWRIADALTTTARRLTEQEGALSTVAADLHEAATLVTTVAHVELAVLMADIAAGQPSPRHLLTLPQHTSWMEHVDPDLVTLLRRDESTPRWWALLILSYADEAQAHGARRNAADILRGIAADYLALHGESRTSIQRLLADGYRDYLVELVTI